MTDQELTDRMIAGEKELDQFFAPSLDTRSREQQIADLVRDQAICEASHPADGITIEQIRRVAPAVVDAR